MNTELKIFKVLSTVGQQKIAETLGISQQEASKKLNGENGFKLPQLAQVFDAGGIGIVGPGHIVIRADEYNALKLLAKKALSDGDD